MDYEKRINDLRARDFSPEEIKIIISEEAKDERTKAIGEQRKPLFNKPSDGLPRFDSRESYLNRPASEKQKTLMTKLGVEFMPGITMPEASVEISKKKAVNKA